MVSGPNNCGVDPSNCCNSITLQTSGSLVNSEQAHVIGNYYKTSNGVNGRYNYQKYGGSEKMWYNPNFNVSNMAKSNHRLLAPGVILWLVFGPQTIAFLNEKKIEIDQKIFANENIL